ncbi:TPA: TrmB family transcriptional regulator [Candidatus Micrarchaeota archaeon]|nr:TrmB family transcriptional regulator [Candidatus Micrarchaeota archaeon]
MNSMPHNPEILDGLRKLGLNQYEARAYHALHSSDTSTAGELSETAELPRPRVYDVLNSLQEKGFVVLQPGRPVRYAALPLDEAIKTLGKQKQETALQEIAAIERIAESLNARIKGNKVADKFKASENVWTLKGRETIYSKLSSMISGASDHVIIVSSKDGAARKFKAHAAELTSAKQRGVNVRLVSSHAVPEATQLTSFHKRTLPTRMAVADDQALLFLTEETAHPNEEVGLWISNPALAATLRQLTTEKN